MTEENERNYLSLYASVKESLPLQCSMLAGRRLYNENEEMWLTNGGVMKYLRLYTM